MSTRAFATAARRAFATAAAAPTPASLPAVAVFDAVVRKRVSAAVFDATRPLPAAALHQVLQWMVVRLLPTTSVTPRAAIARVTAPADVLARSARPAASTWRRTTW